MSYYNLFLPVFKQGDDLSVHLENSKHPAEAFLALAEQYKDAAKICEIVSNSIKNINDITVDANTHYIGIRVNGSKIKKLLKQKIITKDTY